MDGYLNLETQRIAIQEGMSEVQTISASVHEIAHAKLHNHLPKTEDVIANIGCGHAHFVSLLWRTLVRIIPRKKINTSLDNF